MLHRPVKWLGRTLAGVVAFYLAIAVFERLAPEPSVRAWQRFANPNMLALAGVLPGWAVIETTGRTSGLPRSSPVGGRLKRSTFWLVCAERHQAQYVKNIEANPRVRVRVHGRWRPGTAQVLDDDNTVRRMLRLNPLNSLFITIAGRHPGTLRIDLDR
ncbi:MAG TPA: nitroreductase family deazaflavin-dependent oxidoreductase [Acidimicrobiales bacterium]|jgi:deazaflavin-dependent oxidoreductase (nitroreductase family)|nr:nitroreductase family deazaflavin-dependent oxidoreductase [Acidimicrobiales bacterium]